MNLKTCKKYSILIVLLFLYQVSFSKKPNQSILDSLITILSNTGENKNKVNLLNQISSIYCNKNTQHSDDSVRYYISQSIQIAKKISYKKGLAEAFYILGVSNIVGDNQLTKATPFILESLNLYRELQDSASIAKCYLQLGLISYLLEYYEDAIKNFELALQYKSITTAKYLMAISYSEMDSIAKARYYFNAAIYEYKAVGNYNGINECNMYLGKLLIETNQIDSALYFLNFTIGQFKLSGDKFDMGRPYAYLSKAYLKKNDLEKAIHYGEISYQLSLKHFDMINVSVISESLSKAYALKGNYTKAYFFLKLGSAIEDSIFSGSTRQKVADMQNNFDHEKRIHEQKNIQEKLNLNAQYAMQKEKIIRNAFVLGTLLLLCILGILYNRFKLKRRANFALENKNKIISIERDRSESLLLNILPFEVANELKNKGESIAKQYNHVTVLFTDFVNFTGVSEQMSPTELVEEIHRNFTAFDGIMEKHGLEKIKTIGDAYLAVCGLPNETSDHAQRVVKAALEIIDFMKANKGKFQIRIGINSGPVVAGIVGVKKYAYDIWGDTVNTASRMESTSEVGKINISQATYELVKDDFECTYRGKINAKNKGEVDMWFVNSNLNS